MGDPLFIGVSDACKRYNIGRTTLYSLFQTEGCPPIMKLGGKTMIELKPFDAFFRAQLQPSVIEINKERSEK